MLPRKIKKLVPLFFAAMAVYGFIQGDTSPQEAFQKVSAALTGASQPSSTATQHVTVQEGGSVTIDPNAKRRASNYGNAAPNMPGLNVTMDSGWLARQEGGAHGGHTMERHVGKSDDYLRKRLTGETGLRPVRSAGSFSDPVSAEKTVAAILRMYDKRIINWLDDDNAPDTLALEYKGDRNSVTGRGISVNSNRFSKKYGAKVILRKAGRGYGVLTAYPI